MQTYGAIIPGAATLARLLPQQAAEAQAQLTLSRARAPAEVVLSRDGRHRLSVIRWHAEHGRNVARTAAHFGFSRPTIYAWLKRYQRGGPPALEGRSHRPHTVRQPTWSSELEKQVLALREQYPRWVRTSWSSCSVAKASRPRPRWSGASASTSRTAVSSLSPCPSGARERHAPALCHPQAKGYLARERRAVSAIG